MNVLRRCLLAILLSLGLAGAGVATELVVSLSNVPNTGRLVFKVYDDPDALPKA